MRRNRAATGDEDPAARLERVFASVLAQIRQDPAFAQRIRAAFEEAAAEPPRTAAPATPVTAAAQPPAPTSSPLPPAPPPPPKRQKALIDPFALYDTGWEAMLRSHLERLTVEQLRDVIHQYRMDASGRTASVNDIEELRSFIIRAVENFGMR